MEMHAHSGRPIHGGHEMPVAARDHEVVVMSSSCCPPELDGHGHTARSAGVIGVGSSRNCGEHGSYFPTGVGAHGLA
jgi:hypothetical protein